MCGCTAVEAVLWIGEQVSYQNVVVVIIFIIIIITQWTYDNIPL
jgi:hypothetical protein